MIFEVCPHKEAPRLSSMSKDGVQALFDDLAVEMASSTFRETEELRLLLREASLVNLYFWLKYVLAPGGGPFDRLDEDVHLALCNYRQGPECMSDGAHFEIVMPRGTYKTTAMTIGAPSWEIIRFPDLRGRIVNAVIKRAQEFVEVNQKTFCENPLVAWMWPEFHIPNPRSPNGSAECSAGIFTVPNRTKYFKEPTLKAGGATGSSEGDHHDILFIDDILGLDELDSMQRANVDMISKRSWFISSIKSLKSDPEKSRVGVCCTFYSPDDPYQIPVKDAHAIYGYNAEWFRPKVDGRWSLFYKKGREDGKAAFPNIYSERELQRLAQEDRWYYLTQIQNDIYEGGVVEFAKLEVAKGRVFKAEIEYTDGSTETDWVLTRDETPNLEGEGSVIPLSRCHCLLAIDPAATEEGISAKACRTAVGALAIDPEGWVYLFWLRVGFFSIFEMFDHIFEGVEMFEGNIASVNIEANAYQKVLKPLLDREKEERGTFFLVNPVVSTGGKEARIRSILGNVLLKQKFVCCGGTYADFVEEKDLFPGSKFKVDILDMVQLGISALSRPTTDDERADMEYAEEEQLALRSASTGY